MGELKAVQTPKAAVLRISFLSLVIFLSWSLSKLASELLLQFNLIRNRSNNVVSTTSTVIPSGRRSV